MFRRKLLAVATVAVFALVLGAGAGRVFAQEAHGAASAQAEAGAGKCPVSGDEMGAKTDFTAEYEGKVYNLCCAECLAAFQNDPKKYLDHDADHAAEGATHHKDHDHH